MDDQLIMKPAVNAPRFGERIEISGSLSRDDAENLAATLRSGSLPVPIGRIDEGKPRRGVPEFESYVDLTGGAEPAAP